jgi:hypothetical protein
MKNQIARIVLALSIMVMAGLGSYIYLNWGFYPTPGWTPPVQIQDKGSDPLLAYHGELLWFSFSTGGEEGREIKVVQSLNGIEWSSPTILVRESTETCPFPRGIQFLKRPDGQLWFFWSGGTWDTGCRTDILFYSILTDDHQWGSPQEAYLINSEFSFKAIANTQKGGLAVLEQRKNEYVVQILDDTLKKNPPVTLDISSSVISDILLDQHETLWLICRRGNWAFLLASDDGTSWSWPRKIPIENFSPGRLFQRKNGQYVLIYYSSYNSLSMAFSPDTFSWSEPTLAARIEEGDQLENWIDGFDVVESDDGTFWVVIEKAEGFSLTKFSDEQFLEDTGIIMDLRLKNRIIALTVALVAGAAWMVLTRHLSDILMITV